MSGTTSGSVGSQVATALQGTMDSAAIARLVQQLLSAQSAATGGTTAGQTQSTNGTTAGGSQPTTPTGASPSGGTSVSGMQASDYATMMQQLLALLYGKGTNTATGGQQSADTSSQPGGL